MRRRNGSGKFHTDADSGDEINPMDGVANLADVMLVLACGIMLALITYWNVDVGGIKEGAVNVQQGQEVTDVAGLSQDKNGKPVEDSSLEEYGKVYRDPTTGKLYMVTEAP
jgi:hypothetical protein